MKQTIAFWFGAWVLLMLTPACDEAPGQKGPICGNGIQEAGEACEPGDTGSGPCLDAGYHAGLAVCRFDCTYDTSFCTDGTCDNLLDDFGRGYDCDDPACLGRMGCSGESCNDGLDNDGDGLADCMDTADCSDYMPNCSPSCFPTERQHLDGCTDGLDADCDGLVDAEDPECGHPAGFLLAVFPFSYNYPNGQSGMDTWEYPPPGWWGVISISFLAESGDLPATSIHWPVPEGFTEVFPQDRSAVTTGERTVIWTIEALEQGESITVHAIVRVDPDLDRPMDICMRAWLDTDPPIYTTHPFPDVFNDGQTCVRVSYFSED